MCVCMLHLYMEANLAPCVCPLFKQPQGELGKIFSLINNP